MRRYHADFVKFKLSHDFAMFFFLSSSFDLSQQKSSGVINNINSVHILLKCPSKP